MTSEGEVEKEADVSENVLRFPLIPACPTGLTDRDLKFWKMAPDFPAHTERFRVVKTYGLAPLQKSMSYAKLSINGSEVGRHGGF